MLANYSGCLKRKIIRSYELQKTQKRLFYHQQANNLYRLCDVQSINKNCIFFFFFFVRYTADINIKTHTRGRKKRISDKTIYVETCANKKIPRILATRWGKQYVRNPLVLF